MMSDVLTGADSLRFYLTGASRDVGDQPLGDASLGVYRSATEMASLEVRRENGIPGIVIEFVSGMNGFGVGTLESVDGRGVRWAAPGEGFGDDVFLSQGETKIITGASVDRFVRVRRTSDNPLAGSEAVRLSDVVNNAVGGRDTDEAIEPSGSAGFVRCVALENVSASDITDVRVYVEGQITERDPALVSVAIEHPVNRSLMVWGAGTDDLWIGAGAGLTWGYVYDSGTALLAGTLVPGAFVGLWISIRSQVAVTFSPGFTTSLMVRFTDSDSVVHTQRLSGRHRHRSEAAERYELYRGVNAPPDFTAPPWYSFMSFPAGLTLTLGADYQFVLRQRNAYGLLSLNTSATVLRVAGDGSETDAPPSGPFHVGLSQNAVDGLAVHMQYDDAFDSPRATHWALWITHEGQAVNVAGPPDAFVAMDENHFEDTIHSFVGIGSGMQCNVVVRTAVVGATTVYSENSDIHTYELDGRRPDYIHGHAVGGQGLSKSSDPYPSADAVVTQVLDAGLDVRLETSVSRARLYVGTDLVWAAVVNGELEGLYIPDDWHLDTTGGFNEAGATAGAVDVDGTDVWFNIRQYLDYTYSTRSMKLDTVAKAILQGSIDTVTDTDSTHADVPVFMHDGAVYFQVYDPAVGNWRSYMVLGRDFVWHIGLPLDASGKSQGAIEAL